MDVWTLGILYAFPVLRFRSIFLSTLLLSLVCIGIGTGVSHFPVHDMIEARSSKLQSLHPLLFFFFFINMVRLRLLSSSIPAILFLILATASTPLSQSSAATDANFTTCNASFHCGNLPQPLRYPFWGDSRPEYCGDPAFRLDCPRESYPTISILDSAFQVLDINGSDYTMRISGMNLSSSCPEKFNSIELDDKHFLIVAGLSTMLTIFSGCSPESATQHPYYFECGGLPGENNVSFYLKKSEFLGLPSDEQRSITNSCSHNVDVPINNQTVEKLLSHEIELYEAINEGFVVKYNTEVAENCSACQHTNGLCGTNTTSSSSFDHQFVCFCPDEPRSDHCLVATTGKGLGLMPKILIGGLATTATLVVLLSAICCCYRKPWNHSSLLHGNSHRSIEAFIREYQPLASKRYNYSDIRKMTNSFKDKLGQGGYGHVYKGKLPDGRLVAVKVLNCAKGNGEEFINEVATISRTSHVNVVALLGFCFQGNKRALIYEFMPNGSLEKYIRSDHSSVSDHELGAELLYKIAIGIAQGLGYLHRGCSTRILHLDIKPHNILLDEDFIPKISDFGLAKLCRPKESIVSMVDARGTIGYIAPEVFSRNFGGVSHKSDVYSYGMMIMEMVGGKSHSNTGHLSHSSDVYFPHWVYKRLELGEDIACTSSMTVEEKETVKRMTIVGLWCIQTDPSLRPSISKVIEMLKGGSGETLLIPPKPFLSSAASFSRTMSFTASDDDQIQL